MRTARAARAFPVSPAAVAALLRAQREAVARGLDEPCGWLLGVGSEVGARSSQIVAAVAGANLHPAPRQGWQLGPEEGLAMRRAARARGLAVVGTWHGHLLGPARPGARDLEGARLAALPWMLIMGRAGLARTRLALYAWRGNALECCADVACSA